MPNLEDLAAFWSSEGLNHIIPSVGGEFPEGYDVREILKTLIDPADGVLEVGCGYGRLCRAFSADKYIGVDVNPSAIEVAKQKNPDYRFEVISPAAPLPKVGTAYVYTVALHVSDEALDKFLAPICAASPVIVIAEIMDVRWRRAGNPPVFNRDAESYIQTMARFGYRLRSYTKTKYARYDTPEWNLGRDVRLTFHIYERSAEAVTKIENRDGQRKQKTKATSADGDTLHFVSVKWGKKYSTDYVNILYDMIRRNLASESKARFICYTDDSAGIDGGIEIKPLPGFLNGWWNKLYLFKDGVCEAGARIIFIDLDTAVTGDISPICSYKGEFAILRDFYRPLGWNSSFMMWRGGFGAEIWDSFVKAGMPEIDGGDQAWIEKCNPSADILQDLFPGSFASYKLQGKLSPPAGTKIVCFHGEPNPHQVTDGWVARVWKKGGESNETEAAAQENPLTHVAHALTLSFPNVQAMGVPNAGQPICIVGGGPSARDCVDELKQRQAQGAEIWALDNNVQWLRDNGLRVDGHIMASPNRDQADFVPDGSATLFYASQCHPDVFAKAAQMSKDILIWHPMIDGIRTVLNNQSVILVGGGTTTGVLAIALAYTLGCRNMHLYGYDSSYRVEPQNVKQQIIHVQIDGQDFITSVALAQQINEFRMLLKSLVPQGAGIVLHGDGLLPSVMQKIINANAPV